MKTQIKKPIFIGIINHNQTPNNRSIQIVSEWCMEIDGQHESVIVDTAEMSEEQFCERITNLIQNRPAACMYFCLHGTHENTEEFPNGQEFLLLNPTTKITDKNFTTFISSLTVPRLSMFFEVCYSGGLINTLLCDTSLMPIDRSLIMFTACSKDQKCWTIHHKSSTDYWSIGETSQWLVQHHLNPFITPDKCYMAIRKNLPHLQPKYIVLRN